MLYCLSGKTLHLSRLAGMMMQARTANGIDAFGSSFFVSKMDRAGFVDLSPPVGFTKSCPARG